MFLTAVDQRRLDASTLQANDAIVPVRLDFPLSIENILQVLPDTKHVALVIGDSPLEKYWVNEISRELEPFKNRLESNGSPHCPLMRFSDALRGFRRARRSSL
jgi:hypothetical protein